MSFPGERRHFASSNPRLDCDGGSHGHQTATSAQLSWMDSQTIQKWANHYARSGEVVSHILPVLDSHIGLHPLQELFTHDDGRVEKLVGLKGIIPVPFRGATYNCPLALWLPLDYPSKPPITLILPTSTMNIKTSQRVDPNGKVTNAYLSDWEKKSEGCSITALLEVLQGEFGQEYPLVSVSSKRAAKPQPPPAQPTPPPPPIASTSRASPSPRSPPPPAKPPSGPPRPPLPPQFGRPPQVGSPDGMRRPESAVNGSPSGQGPPPRPPPPNQGPSGYSTPPSYQPRMVAQSGPPAPPPNPPAGYGGPPPRPPPPTSAPIGPSNSPQLNPPRPTSADLSTSQHSSPQIPPAAPPHTGYSGPPPHGLVQGAPGSSFVAAQVAGFGATPPQPPQSAPPYHQNARAGTLPTYYPPNPPIQQYQGGPRPPQPPAHYPPQTSPEPSRQEYYQPSPPPPPSGPPQQQPQPPPQQAPQQPSQQHTPPPPSRQSYLPAEPLRPQSPLRHSSVPQSRQRPTSQLQESIHDNYNEQEQPPQRSYSPAQYSHSRNSSAVSDAAYYRNPPPAASRSPSPPPPRRQTRLPDQYQSRRIINGHHDAVPPNFHPVTAGRHRDYSPTPDERYYRPAPSRELEREWESRDRDREYRERERDPRERERDPRSSALPPPSAAVLSSRVLPPASKRPARPALNILDGPDDMLSDSAGSSPSNLNSPQSMPPPVPPNPELMAIRTRLHSQLTRAQAALTAQTSEQLGQLALLETDLLKGEPAILDEMQRLEAVRDICRTVRDRYKTVVDEGEGRLADYAARGEGPEVDEIVCSSTVVYNQLLELVAEDAALEDTIYQLGRGLNSETANIDLDRFLKRVRGLAREQFLARAKINKILINLAARSSSTPR